MSPRGYIPLGSDGKAERQEVNTEMAKLKFVRTCDRTGTVFWTYEEP